MHQDGAERIKQADEKAHWRRHQVGKLHVLLSSINFRQNLPKEQNDGSDHYNLDEKCKPIGYSVEVKKTVGDIG
jgi:hypothetical protein